MAIWDGSKKKVAGVVVVALKVCTAMAAETAGVSMLTGVLDF